MIRTAGGPGVRSVRVGEPDLFVTLFPAENRSEMAPRKGDAVKCWFGLYDGRDFKTRLAGAPFRPTAEFEFGSDRVWPWLAVVPVKAAAGAAEWLPKGYAAADVYVEVSLAAVRGK